MLSELLLTIHDYVEIFKQKIWPHKSVFITRYSDLKHDTPRNGWNVGSCSSQQKLDFRTGFIQKYMLTWCWKKQLEKIEKLKSFKLEIDVGKFDLSWKVSIEIRNAWMKLESSIELGKLANLTDYLSTLNRINFRLFNWEFPNFKLSKFSIFQLSFQTPCKPKYDFTIFKHLNFRKLYAVYVK